MSDAIDCLLHTLQTHPELDGPRHGRALFLGARPHEWFQSMQERLTCAQRYKPLADAVIAAGMPFSKAPEGTFDLVMVIPDRQRQRLYSDLARAYDLLTPGGTMVAVVPNDWGAKRAEEALGKAVGGVKSLSKKHCRAFWAHKTPSSPKNPAMLEEWRDYGVLRREMDGRFWTLPGLFSWDHVDVGSQVLVEHLPKTLSGHGADLGAGWGFLSDHILRTCHDVRALDCFEADFDALEVARRNLGSAMSPARVRLHWQDVTVGLNNDVRYDFIVMNPPFHDGRDADPMLGLRFITSAVQALRTGGQLWLVANKHLPYENLMSECFETATTVHESAGFKVMHGQNPTKGQWHRPRKRR
ncbi:MAG: class I SAM-dependent methyltransferase [Verrucomicrobiales bacterium]|nr:class I SAM-dependent methyltransferase [Verrucomicrobiales bacterium]MCP5557775.1 class I SAM-dependent methyltransferase [Verrucomicrobiaceae bacterium]